MISRMDANDHDTGRLVWAAAGRDRKTVQAFLDALGEELAGEPGVAGELR